VNSREYYASVQKAILAAPHVIQTDIAFDEISEEECLRLMAALNFILQSMLSQSQSSRD
jgi:hypothetical protein